MRSGHICGRKDLILDPRDAPWGERYFHMRDPDGHELSSARPPTTSRPREPHRTRLAAPLGIVPRSQFDYGRVADNPPGAISKSDLGSPNLVTHQSSILESPKNRERVQIARD